MEDPGGGGVHGDPSGPMDYMSCQIINQLVSFIRHSIAISYSVCLHLL